MSGSPSIKKYFIPGLHKATLALHGNRNTYLQSNQIITYKQYIDENMKST